MVGKPLDRIYAAKEIWEVLFMGADGDGRGYTDRQRERLSKAATAAGIAMGCPTAVGEAQIEPGLIISAISSAVFSFLR